MTRPAMTEARRQAVHGKLAPMEQPTLRDKLRALNRARRGAGEVSLLRGTALLLGVAGLAAIVCAAF